MARNLWLIEVWHDGLNKYRCIRGYDKEVVERKAAAQKAAWNELWERKSEQQQKALEKLQKVLEKKELIEEARKRSEEASEAIKVIENTLKHTLEVNDIINWEILKDNSIFSKPELDKPKLISVPEPPKSTDTRYQPGKDFLDFIFPSRKQKKINNAKLLFENDYERWKEQKERVPIKNAEIEKQYQNDLKQWEAEKQEFLRKQQENNEIIEKRKEQYFQKQSDAVLDYCELVLSNSKYPDNFPQEYDLDYNPETKILIVDYSLPSPDVLPKIKEVKYAQSKNQFVETYLSEPFLNKLYDSLIYQITLRTIHELYEADVVNAIDSVVFNGWVKTISQIK